MEAAEVATMIAENIVANATNRDVVLREEQQRVPQRVHLFSAGMLGPLALSRSAGSFACR